ncbi:acetyl-CoA carboxylase carboxyltransferase subunit alpha [Jutongia sp.]|uniref:acetyl-CoA carboxylase carboxyltransferase subunit alpha n=1 Tax=Jutongia sp. TaxID=2944204 RepID=UPI00307A18EC
MNESMRSVTIARKIDRPSAKQFINEMFDDFLEFHGDRLFGDDGAIVGGIARLNEMPVTVIGIQKGHTLEENVNCNFGQPNPEGYRKALRLMKQAEKFHRPVITLINTAGAFPGVGAEERGQGEAIARNLMEMSRLKTPIISIFIGEGGSGGALALAVGDQVWMLEHAVYSILSPEGFSSILWKDPTRVAEAAEKMKMTAGDLLKNHVADRMFFEPEDGLELHLPEVAKELKQALTEVLPELLETEMEELLQKRYERFRQFGSFVE